MRVISFLRFISCVTSRPRAHYSKRSSTLSSARAVLGGRLLFGPGVAVCRPNGLIFRTRKHCLARPRSVFASIGGCAYTTDVGGIPRMRFPPFLFHPPTFLC